MRSQVSSSYFRENLPNLNTQELNIFLNNGFQPPVSDAYLPQIIASTVVLAILLLLGKTDELLKWS